MTYKCGCGKEFSSKQSLSNHGVGNNRKHPCSIYTKRKSQGLPLNVYNITITNNINQSNTDIDELSDKLLEKMKIHFVPKRKLKEIIEYDYDYIYLIREARFIKGDINIYKIGRTFRKPDKRMAEYPPGSEALLLMKSHHSKRDETQLLKVFEETFEIRRDMGSEYFMGDWEKMIKIIVDFLMK